MENKPITCHVELLLENGKIEKLIAYLNQFNLIPGKTIVIVDVKDTTAPNLDDMVIRHKETPND